MNTCRIHPRIKTQNNLTFTFGKHWNNEILGQEFNKCQTSTWPCITYCCTVILQVWWAYLDKVCCLAICFILLMYIWHWVIVWRSSSSENVREIRGISISFTRHRKCCKMCHIFFYRIWIQECHPHLWTGIYSRNRLTNTKEC